LSAGDALSAAVLGKSKAALKASGTVISNLVAILKDQNF